MPHIRGWLIILRFDPATVDYRILGSNEHHLMQVLLHSLSFSADASQ